MILKHFILLFSLVLFHFSAFSQLHNTTWVGEDNEHLNISKKIAFLQKGTENRKFEMVKHVKNKYFVLSSPIHSIDYMVKYNIVSLTHDTLVLAPEGEDCFKLCEATEQNQYVFVNSMLNYKFVKLHYVNSLGNGSLVTLDIDSAKRSIITVNDLYSNEIKTYKSPVTKRDYKRLIKILSSCDLSCYPNENITIDSTKCYNPNLILEIRYNDQKITFNGCFAIPRPFIKFEDFVWEYISLSSRWK